MLQNTKVKKNCAIKCFRNAVTFILKGQERWSMPRSLEDYFVVQFSIRDEIGSLAAALQEFQVRMIVKNSCRVGIININAQHRISASTLLVLIQ